jgi:hypothetical protein
MIVSSTSPSSCRPRGERWGSGSGSVGCHDWSEDTIGSTLILIYMTPPPISPYHLRWPLGVRGKPGVARSTPPPSISPMLTARHKGGGGGGESQASDAEMARKYLAPKFNALSCYPLISQLVHLWSYWVYLFIFFKQTMSCLLSDFLKNALK